MQIIRKHFPPLIPDNEEMYFSMVKGSIESIDELSSLQITKALDGFQFRLTPSLPKYTNFLIQEILKLHNYLGLHLDMSKSIKTSSVITFTINLK